MSGLSIVTGGFQRAAGQLEGAAERLSRASLPGENVDVAQELVTMDVARAQSAASVTVARTVAETLGRLVDTFA